MRPRKFEVKEIKHDSGRTTYEAFGRVGKKLHRKRFQTYDEAARYVEALEARHTGALNRRRSVLTSLNDRQASDAENALAMLKKAHPDQTLTWAVGKLIDLYESDITTIGLEEAKNAFIAARKQKGLSKRQLRDYGSLLKGLIEKTGPEKQVDSIEREDIERFLESRNLEAAKSWNNVIGNLSAFFNWACLPRQKHLLAKDNPMQLFEKRKVTENQREILGPEDTKTLMEIVEGYQGGRFVHYFSFCLFAGIRPDSSGEITRLALNLQERTDIIDLKNKVLTIEAALTKDNDRRQITIQAPLEAYLKEYPYAEYPIVPPNSTNAQALEHLKRKIPELKSKLPITIPHDGLRHTFISNHLMLSKSFAKTAMESGNSESIIRKHYAKRVTDEDAAAFWAIRPTKRSAL